MDTVFSSAKLALRTMHSQPKPKERGPNKGYLPTEAFCHVCLTEEKHPIYAWRDYDGVTVPGYPYSNMTQMGCGGCGGSRCDDWCTPALAIEGERVVSVQPQRDPYPVHPPCSAHVERATDHTLPDS